mmetsp:Transcript_55237/g.119299  ORF Transcript_55237/g.119299 Transcript_55237/m.119299 type:complete len:429 (+) Transcript_55237:303-1589(+)
MLRSARPTRWTTRFYGQLGRLRSRRMRETTRVNASRTMLTTRAKQANRRRRQPRWLPRLRRLLFLRSSAASPPAEPAPQPAPVPVPKRLLAAAAAAVVSPLSSPARAAGASPRCSGRPRALAGAPSSSEQRPRVMRRRRAEARRLEAHRSSIRQVAPACPRSSAPAPGLAARLPSLGRRPVRGKVQLSLVAALPAGAEALTPALAAALALVPLRSSLSADLCRRALRRRLPQGPELQQQLRRHRHRSSMRSLRLPRSAACRVKERLLQCRRFLEQTELLEATALSRACSAQHRRRRAQAAALPQACLAPHRRRRVEAAAVPPACSAPRRQKRVEAAALPPACSAPRPQKRVQAASLGRWACPLPALRHLLVASSARPQVQEGQASPPAAAASLAKAQVAAAASSALGRAPAAAAAVPRHQPGPCSASL